MTSFEAKYEINEGSETRAYHKSRRMFAIKDDVIYIADEGADYSHAEWFKKLGWIDEDNDNLMNSLTRGSVETSGVYFYVGYKFEVNETAENDMKANLPGLVKRLRISPEISLFGGKVFDEARTVGARRSYGQIKNLLK